MNKLDVAKKMAAALGLAESKAVEAIEAFTLIVTDSLVAGEDVTIVGFGMFIPRKRKARTGVNPQNPSEKIQIPEILVPKFRAGKSLKDALKAAKIPE